MIIPAKGSYREIYEIAMRVTTQEQADEYFAALVEHHLAIAAQQGHEVSREEAEAIQRINIAYFAGYYDTETRIRIEQLFQCEHPIFGKVVEKGVPSMEEAFTLGYEAGMSARMVDEADTCYPPEDLYS